MSALTRIALRTSRAADFASEKELVAQTGHRVDAWPLVVAKELVDNALDACEEARVAPEIEVVVDDVGITVADNGPGLPAATIAGALDFDVRVSSREAYVAPDRGAQGNALKTILAMPFVLDGECGRTVIRAAGIRHEIEFRLDPLGQRPVLAHRQGTDESVRIGTRVTVEWPDSACSTLADAEARFLQHADGYTWLNPHLRLAVDWFEERTVVEATTPGWPKWRASDPTCPQWYETPHLARLIAGYVQHDAEAGRSRTVREFVAEFRGLRGTQKQKVLDATGLSRATLASLCSEDGLDSDTIGALLQAMKAATKPVKPSALGVIGREHLSQRFEAAGCEMRTFEYRKKIGVTDGLPWVVEAAFAWCPDALDLRLVTGVNWSPGIQNPFRDLDGTSLDTLLGQQRVYAERWSDAADDWIGGGEPVALMVHLACPRIEYTDRGKSAAVIEEDVGEAIATAVAGATKRWAKQRKAEERRANARSRRRDALVRSCRVTLKDAAWRVMEQAYLKASSNGTLPAHARQVMYAARGPIQELTGKSLDDQYFCQTLLPDYMSEHEETEGWDVVYDDRGHLREPHTGRVIGLGTLGVREYIRMSGPSELGEIGVRSPRVDTRGPHHRYVAILFVEKEGFMPLLERVQLAERHDIAVMSTKGMSNTASRLLVDELCSRYDVPLLVARDFDKAGFSIAGTLKRDTRRYSFQNDVRVVDLGLRLEDVRAWSLESEDVFTRDDRSAAAANLSENGATEEEVEFLLERRVELNAFSSGDLVAWLEEKLSKHGVEKVVPKKAFLVQTYRRFLEVRFLEERVSGLLDEARERAASARVPRDLRDEVVRRLADEPSCSWDAVIERIARER